MLKFAAYLLPFLLTGLFVYYVVENKQTSPSLPKPVAEKTEVDKITDYINEFVENSSATVAPEQFLKIKIQNNKKIFNFAELNETKQNILKILIYKQVLNKTDEFIKSNGIRIENFETLKDFYKKIENNIVTSKQNIYKIHGSTIHALDKDLLESLK